jgi:hypothetical protein
MSDYSFCDEGELFSVSQQRTPYQSKADMANLKSGLGTAVLSPFNAANADLM